MIKDYALEFAQNQALRATGAATNAIPLGTTLAANAAGVGGALAADVAKGQEVGVTVHIDSAYNNLTDLTVAIQGCDDAAGTNPVEIVSKKFLLADVNAVRFLPFPDLVPGVKKKYLRAYVTITGTAPATGNITIALTPVKFSEKPNNDLISA